VEGICAVVPPCVSFLVLVSFVGNWFGFGVSGFRFTFEKRGWGWKLSSTGKGDKERGGRGMEIPSGLPRREFCRVNGVFF
jgi:hypothetical protein